MPASTCSFSTMPYRLLALDIDGTLVTDDRVVTERTVTAIGLAVKKGVWVTLCTGRSISTSRPVAEQVQLNAPLILNGGALLYDISHSQPLYACNLEKTLALEAVYHLRAVQCHPIVYSPLPDCRYFYYDHPNRENAAFLEYLRRNPERACLIPDVTAALREDAAYIVVTDRNERIRSLAPALEECLREMRITLEVSPINREYCHLTVAPYGISKGSGLRMLAHRLGISLCDTIAVGDNLNDLDLLDTAGLGVAMGNAVPETKAHANYVTASNNEDGVAEVIERFILNEE